MATAVRVRFPPSAPARHQGLWQLAATLSFLVVSSSAASPARPLFFLPLRSWVKLVVQKVPQMPSAAASSAHPHGTCHSHPATRRSGQHLLCVGRIFYFRCALPAAAKKRLGNAEIRLSLGTCFRQEAKLLACQLFALLHASLPGVPDLRIFPRCGISLSGICLPCRERMSVNTDDFQGRLPLRPAAEG